MEIIKVDFHNHLSGPSIKSFNRLGFKNRVIDLAAERLGAVIAGGVYPSKMTKKQINENPGKVRADLHNHFAHDNLRPFDRKGFFNKTIEIAKQRLGKGGILGLVNCLGKRYEKFAELKGYDRQEIGNAIYVPGKDILIVKAQEVFAKQGDILVLGLPRDYYIGKENNPFAISLEDALKEVKELNGIIGLDHGFFVDGVGPYLEKNYKLLEYFDFIEVHNGNAWITPFANRKAQEFYKRIKNDYDIGAICSSDGHSLFEICSSYSLLDKVKVDYSSAERLTESLRKPIREHKDWSEDKRENSYLGALVHAVIITLENLKRKK